MANSNNGTGNPSDEIPVGFSMTLAMNKDALEGYAKMTDVQKEEIINKSRQAKSKTEMQHIVNSITDTGK